MATVVWLETKLNVCCRKQQRLLISAGKFDQDDLEYHQNRQT